MSIIDIHGFPLTQSARSTNHTAASRGRRASVMPNKSTGPNTAHDGELATIRNRSRDAVRNNPYHANALRGLVKHEVGSGITCKFLVEDEGINDQLTEAWKESLPEMCADGVGHFHAGQRLGSRARNESGEVFMRRRKRSMSSGLNVPMQVQFLEPDVLDLTLNVSLRNNNVVRSGIEMNNRGDAIAYWFFKNHPNDLAASQFGGTTQRVRILAKDVVHHFIPLRPGQRRGIPVSTAAIFKSANLDSYDDYELERKKNHASFTGTIEKNTPSYNATGQLVNPITGEPYDDSEEIPNVNITAGMIQELLPGETLKLYDAEKGGEFYADYMRQQLFAVAATHGIPYEFMTGDWSNISNDRVIRAIVNDFQREVEAIQEIYLVTQICQSTLAWWMDAAVLSGRIDLPDYTNRRAEYLKVDWRPQGWQYVHPVQDVDAATKRIESGFSTHEKEARKLGCDSEDVLEANIRYAAKKKQLEEDNGLVEDNEETEKTEDE